MLQSPELQSLPAELRSALSPLMTGATFREEAVHEGCLPLLLMLRSYSVTAFAIGDEADYEPLYQAFKKYYVKRTSEWSTKDVSFVFCLPAKTTVHESFRSRVEVDVYFCRKYVVQLDQDIAASLARLPFLPLSPVTSGVQTRPPSAQTLLRQRNLKTDLAKALVVPSKSSASSIFSACLDGVYGAPDRIEGASAAPSLVATAEERVQATLKSISIQNFRAYRTKREFELGSSVTVLYGPNGFGKTSFFDAVDFAVTGGVGRLAKDSGGLAKAAKHLDSDNEPTVVTLTLEREGKQHVITRDLAEHNNAQVNGKTTSRKDILSLLTGGASAAADRVENLVALFRATHLFSQDSQELTCDVAEKCELPADIVSRMLAFEDYVSGLKKAEDVLKTARQALTEAKKQAQNARNSVDADRVELKRLTGLTSVDTSPDALNARFIDLEQEISSSGINISGISLRDTRALRAMLESSATESASSRANVSKALEHVAGLRVLRGQLESVRTQLEERQALVESAEASSNAASERLGLLASDLAQLKSQEQTAQNQRGWLAWASSVQPEYVQLNDRNQTLTESLSALNPLLNQNREDCSNTLNAQQSATAALQRINETLKTAGDATKRIQRVKEQARLWAQAEARFVAAQNLEIKLQDLPELKRAQLGEMQQAITAQEHLVARLERELGSARNSDTNLQKLIAELRTHINSATCVLCGHDHGSQEALLTAIDKRMAQSDLVVRLSDTLVTERKKLQTQVGARRTLFDDLSQIEAQLEQTKNEREQLEQQRENFATALTTLGLALSDETDQHLAQKSTQAHEAELLATSTANDAREMLAKADAAHTTAYDRYQALERERKAVTTSLEGTRDRLNELLAEANRGAVNLAAGLPSITGQVEALQERLGQINLAIQNANTLLDAQKGVQAAAKATLNTARTSFQQAVQLSNTYETNLQSLTSALTAAGFDSEVSDAQLRQRIQEYTSREGVVLRLRDRVADLEVAVDTAATSAAFQNMRNRILTNEKLVEQADERTKKIEPWVTYFEDITKLLGGQQAVATEHFIKEYGPRTAVIQQRLRPVYGFAKLKWLARTQPLVFGSTERVRNCGLPTTSVSPRCRHLSSDYS